MKPRLGRLLDCGAQYFLILEPVSFDPLVVEDGRVQQPI